MSKALWWRSSALLLLFTTSPLAAEVQHRNCAEEDTKGRNRPFQSFDNESRRGNSKKQHDIEHRKKRVRPQAHRQTQQPLALDGLTKPQMRAQDHQPDKQHARNSRSVKHEEGVFRGKNSQQ